MIKQTAWLLLTWVGRILVLQGALPRGERKPLSLVDFIRGQFQERTSREGVYFRRQRKGKPAPKGKANP